MNVYIWRTVGNSTYKYVCGYTGSDYYGDGTQSNPYKTLTKAFYSTGTGAIICRGIFNDNLQGSGYNGSVLNYSNNNPGNSDGGSSISSCSTIVGDYYGASIWDGQGVSVLSGFATSNMVLLNTSNTIDLGIGFRDNWWSGNTGGVPFNLFHNCKTQESAIGGIATYNNIYSSLIPTSTSKLYLSKNPSVYNHSFNNTIHNIAKSSMRQNASGNAFNFLYSLFTDFAVYLDQTGTFNNCLFNSGCTFWIADAQFVPTGITDDDKLASIVDKVSLLSDIKISIVNCKYTSQTSHQIYTNIDKLDFTLKPNSDAIIKIVNPSYPSQYYYGAMKPALNIPIMANSEGIIGTWDEHTASGAIAIPSDSIIYLDETNTSSVSQISSKIVAIDNQMILLDGFKSMFFPRFNYKCYLGDKQMISSTKIYSGTNLNIGRYIVNGFPVLYNTQNLEVGDILVVTSDGTLFTNYNTNISYLYEILDPNIYNPIHVRMTNAIYASVPVGGTLQTGGVYLNYSNQNITYKGRTIISGESFTCDGINMTFSGSVGYVIGIVFDDNRVPVTEWISALLFDDYFNGKTGAVQNYDNEGRPISSGNPKAYAAPYVGTYGMQYINKTYVQFKIILRKYDTI